MLLRGGFGVHALVQELLVDGGLAQDHAVFFITSPEPVMAAWRSRRASASAVLLKLARSTASVVKVLLICSGAGGVESHRDKQVLAAGEKIGDLLFAPADLGRVLVAPGLDLLRVGAEDDVELVHRLFHVRAGLDRQGQRRAMAV